MGKIRIFWFPLIFPVVNFKILFLNPTENIYGEMGDNVAGSIFLLYLFRNFNFNDLNYSGLIFFPFGDSILQLSSISQLVPILQLFVLSRFFDPILALNIFIIINFISLNFVFYFYGKLLFTREISTFILLLSLNSCLFLYVRAAGHVAYLTSWTYFLTLYYMSKVIISNDKRYLKKVYFFLILTIFSDVYLALFVIVSFGLFVIFMLRLGSLAKQPKLGFFSVLFFLTLIIVFYILKELNNEALPKLSPNNFTVYSGKSWQLLAPPSYLPFLPDRYREWYDNKVEFAGTNFTESTNFIGYQNIFLLLIVLSIFMKILFENGFSKKLFELKAIFVFYIFLFLIFLTIYIPQKVAIFGFSTNTPIFYFNLFFPYFRSTNRASLVLFILVTLTTLIVIEKQLSIKKQKVIGYLCAGLCLFQISLNKDSFVGYSNFQKFPISLKSNKIESLFFYPPEDYAISSDGRWHSYIVFASKPVLNTISKSNNQFVIDTLHLAANDLASLLSNLNVSHIFVNDELIGSKFISNPYFVLVDKVNLPYRISGVKRASLYQVLPPVNHEEFLYPVFNNFYALEKGNDFYFRWSKSRSSMCFYGKTGVRANVNLSLKSLFKNDTLQIENKSLSREVHLTNKSTTEISLYVDSNSCIYFKSDKVGSPKSLNLNDDNRILSFLVYTDKNVVN
jgi:hypothetical protein